MSIEATQSHYRYLMRKLRRELPQYCLFECYQRDFLLYKRVFRQLQNHKDKIYSLHELQVYCLAGGEDSKQFEYGSQTSIARTAEGTMIAGAVSHEQNLHTIILYRKYCIMLRFREGKLPSRWYAIAAIITNVKSMEYCLRFLLMIMILYSVHNRA